MCQPNKPKDTCHTSHHARSVPCCPVLALLAPGRLCRAHQPAAAAALGRLAHVGCLQGSASARLDLQGQCGVLVLRGHGQAW
jgi:hypothetical protein